MEISDLVLYPERVNFDPSESERFDFEFKVPSGEEYCATYIHTGGCKFSPWNYRFDHVNRWEDDKCIPVSIDEANQNLKPAGFTVYDIFSAELEKNMRAELFKKNKPVAFA